MSGNKFFRYLSSWKKIDLDKKYSCIIFGPQAGNQVLYFSKNYCLVDPINHNIYNFKLFFTGIVHFIKNFILNPILYFKLIKFWPTIFFVTALIKRKKIKVLISLVDYNYWPIHFKNILGENVYTLTVQNSLRYHPLNRMKNLNKFDEYLLWSDLSKEELKECKGNTKIVKFGALKSYYSIEKNKKWKEIKKYPSRESDNKFFLISTFTEWHKKFYLEKFNRFDFEEFKENIKNIDINRLSLQDISILEHLHLCIYLKNYFKKRNVNFEIIERNFLHKNLINSEKDFFSSIFGRVKFLNKTPDEKLDHILNNKNAIYITNSSNLGFECLALNMKAFFFSKWLYKYNPNNFQLNHNFFSIDEDQEKFDEKLDRLLNMNSEEYNKNILKLKSTITSCVPSKEKLEYFFKTTGLRFNL